MKEAFLAALLGVGPNADNQIQLMEIVAPVNISASETTAIIKYVPAITPADTKADVEPQVIRHITASHS